MAQGDTLTIAADGNQAFTPSFKGCRVTMNANQTVTNTIAAVAWDGTETYDTVGMHSPSNQPSRVTIPTGEGGYWRYTVHVNGITTSGTQTGVLQLYVNGIFVHGLDERAVSSGTVHGFLATDVLDLDAGDYVEIFFGTGATSAWRANSSGSYFAMEKLNL